MRRAMTEHAQVWRIGPVYIQHAKWAVCQECVELRLGVPGLGGFGARQALQVIDL